MLIARIVSKISDKVVLFVFCVVAAGKVFFMNRNTEQAQCALSQVCIPKEKEKKVNEKNKTKI